MDSNSRQISDETIVQTIEKSITNHREAVKKINDEIFKNPELAWEEITAHNAICDYFSSLGPDYKVHRHAYGIETSFLIEATQELSKVDTTSLTPSSTSSHVNPRTIVYNAEYDALPNMNVVQGTDPPEYIPAHACGHNLIASASIAAFIACWEVLKSTHSPGTVKLLGTPAEENGGGKIKLLEAGAYANVNACVMVHPGPLASDETLKAVAFTRSLASQRLTADFKGLASHAGGAPWHGKNALDALVTSYVAISTLRQQLRPDLRVAGVVKEGGTASNVIPDHTVAEYSIRATSRTDLEDLCDKVTRCFVSGGQAADCDTNVDARAAYWETSSNPELCCGFTKRMNEFGVKTVYELPEITDNPGNVSHYCPAMQAAFFIESDGAVNHTPEFAKAAGTDDAFMRAIDCAKGLPAVGFDVLTDDKRANETQAIYVSDILAKAAAVAQTYGKTVPSQEQVNALIASPPHPIQRLLKTPGFSRHQVIAALMAVDAYLDKKRGLF
ncbi:hypothetical protein H633G_10656 [Metarhizium anisopliae BRIP 53284]|nr:hypothetical protein H633G_10656 [Metarhizium anisopliae BRIP 53284]